MLRVALDVFTLGAQGKGQEALSFFPALAHLEHSDLSKSLWKSGKAKRKCDVHAADVAQQLNLRFAVKKNAFILNFSEMRILRQACEMYARLAMGQLTFGFESFAWYYFTDAPWRQCLQDLPLDRTKLDKSSKKGQQYFQLHKQLDQILALSETNGIEDPSYVSFHGPCDPNAWYLMKFIKPNGKPWEHAIIKDIPVELRKELRKLNEQKKYKESFALLADNLIKGAFRYDVAQIQPDYSAVRYERPTLPWR